MDKLDSCTSPAWKSLYSTPKNKGHAKPGEGTNRSRLHNAAGRDVSSGAQQAPGKVGKSLSNAAVSIPSLDTSSTFSSRPDSARFTAVTNSRSSSACRPKQLYPRPEPQSSPRSADEAAAAPRNWHTGQQTHVLQQDAIQQLAQAGHVQQQVREEIHMTSPTFAEIASTPMERPSTSWRGGSLPQQVSRQLCNQSSPYLAPPPKSARRPRSPGPRPGSPLSGLSRPSAQSKSSSNSGHQEQSSYVNSTALAGSIYGRQQMSSRLGPMPRTGHKRPLHHQQKHCAFQIQVNYGPTGVNDQPEIDGNGCAANRLNVLNAPGTTVKCCAEQQPGARATSMAANTPTATAECSWHSGENNEQELGMTLSEYIAQMHTTPVACNSVSGLGDESNEEEAAAPAHWQATTAGGSILSASTMPGSVIQPASGSQDCRADSDCAEPHRPAASASCSGVQIKHGDGNMSSSPFAATAAATGTGDITGVCESGSPLVLDSCSSSSSSIDDEVHLGSDSLEESEGASDMECYPDVCDSSDTDDDHQSGGNWLPVASSREGGKKSGGPVAAATAAASGRQPAAVLRPTSSAGRRACAGPSCTKSTPAGRAPSGFLIASTNSLDLRPATALLATRSTAAADITLTDNLGLNGPGGQRRSFTDLDCPAEGFVKEVSLGHLSAALFTPAPAAAEVGSNRASWQQLWGSSSLSVRSSGEPERADRVDEGDSSSAGRTRSGGCSTQFAEQQHAQLQACRVCSKTQPTALILTRIQQQDAPGFLQRLSASTKQSPAGTAAADGWFAHSNETQDQVGCLETKEAAMGTSSRPPSVAAAPQHPAAVSAWGTTTTGSQAAADQAPTATARASQSPVKAAAVNNPGRLFTTRHSELLPAQCQHDHHQQQQAMAPQACSNPATAHQRPPSRQKPPAESLHLFTGFSSMQPSSSTSRADKSSPPAPAGVAGTQQHAARPATPLSSVWKQGERRPASVI